MADEKFTVPLGTLSVGKQIGEGGFGVVHEAKIEKIDFDFAVKFLNPSAFQFDLDTARKRFFREAETLLKLRHPHIIAIYGLGEHDGRPYILMERFKGADLGTARQKGPHDPERILPFMEGAASALHYAHSNGIVHRDLKPTNLMSKKGEARVLDFGVAAKLDPEGTRLTKLGGTVAGDAFAAPEMIDHPRQVDARSDIFSLGACWFWLLTGRPPKGTDLENLLRGSVKISPEYEQVLLRTIAQVDARYQSMDELRQDVARLRNEERPSAAPDKLTDTEALVLGVVASHSAGDSESCTLYQLQQELGNQFPKLTIVLAQKKLRKLGLTDEADPDWDYKDYTGPCDRATEAGWAYVQQHHDRINELMSTSQPEPAFSSDDDVPF